MAESLLRSREIDLTADDYELIQRLRLAGLLHDVGHYPFSHATQDAVENFCAQHTPFFKHENLGGEILKHDPDIRQVLDGDGIDPKDIAAIFSRSDPDFKLANLISSDLDADRLDYLPRTSHFSGLPYGSIDLDYIISQLCEDNEKRPCLTLNAVRAADAFLIARLMDYQQIAYHKSVAAYEWLLKEVIQALLTLEAQDGGDNKLDLSQEGVIKRIQERNWARFTDDNIYARIDRELQLGRKFGDPVIELMARAMLARTGPKTVAAFHRLARPFLPGPGAFDVYVEVRKRLAECAHQVAADFGFDPRLFKVWKERKALTKVGSRVAPPAQEKDDEDQANQMIRLTNPGGESVPITSVQHAMCSIMAEYNVEMIRVFVLLPPELQERRKEIEQRFREREPAAGLPT